MMGQKKYTIAIFHYIANFTDGVSLEMNKWKRVFEEMGHKVYLCAGMFGSDEEVLIEEMYHHRPDVELLTRNTFKALKDFPDEASYREALYHLAGIIEDKMGAFIEEKNIDLLVPQNVWSVAANPAVAIALTNIMREYNLPALAHNHDFYFERTTGIAMTCSTAVELADRYLPPRDPLVKHVVINSLGQRELLARKGIPSTVVPNVFDFDAPPWLADNFNKDFRERFGLRENDICVLQATRIVTRKGIELAVDFVHALNSPERRAQLKAAGLYDGRKFSDENDIVLVLAGTTKDDGTYSYAGLLAKKAKQMGVKALFIEEFVSESRMNRNGEKIYSLWDTYVHADFVTYPSIWEGWGNQLLEAVRAKLPIVLYEYPVYLADIKDKGFQVTSLGNEINGRDEFGLVTIEAAVIESAADEAIELLTNAQLRQDTVDHNFRIGKKHFSMDALYIYLEQLMQSY